MESTGLKGVLSFFFWYETPKVVHIKSKKVGILGRFLQLCIFAYIGGYVMYYQKGYQNVGDVESTVVTKVKGVTYSSLENAEHVPAEERSLYERVWDVSDLIVPPSENGAFFLTTNLVITPNQTRSTCGEDIKVPGAVCDPINSSCVLGKAFEMGNGVMTGNCIPSSQNETIHVCEIYAWCPVEVDDLPWGPTRALLDVADFTVLIKNFIEFPTFGRYYRKRNILSSSNATYLQACRYDPVNHPFCPVFRIGDILEMTGGNYSTVAPEVHGAVITIAIDWNCNLDLDFAEYCIPRYSFRRVDDPEAVLAPGWNFRHAMYHEENRRTLTKAFGIRFLIDVRGRAGKFAVVPTLLNIGSGLALLGLTQVVCDFIILYLVKRRSFYKDVKYLKVKGDDAFENEPISPRGNNSYESLPPYADDPSNE